THLGAGDLLGDAVAGHQLVVFLPQLAVARVVLGVDDFEVTRLDQVEAGAGNAPGDDGRATDQDRTGQTFFDRRTHGVQHARIFAFGIDHPLVLRFDLLGLREHRLHDDAGGVDEVR